MGKSKWPLIGDRLSDIETWLKKGLTEAQVCQNLGVSVTTWEKYKATKPELLEVIKKGRISQVSEVENSLFKAATGYYYTTEEMVKVKDPGGGEHVEVRKVTKFKPPDTGAMVFFLKNKNRTEWADNPQMVELKREELELRRQESEFRSW